MTGETGTAQAGALMEELALARLDERGREWLAAAGAELAAGASDARFCALLAQASRYAKGPLAPSAEQRARAAGQLPGWDPERWSAPEALRVALVLALPGLDGERGAAAIEEAFRYADLGEACALYRALPLLPGPERFRWRAGEGCRSNMRAVFEAVACDSPYPAAQLDEVAWKQLVVKSLFVGAPLWRVHGLDGRLSEDLARMALDLADERRSAGRPVRHELWLALGPHGGARALASIERELDPANELAGTLERRAAALGLARAGRAERLAELAEGERDPEVARTMRAALAGEHGQGAFRELDPELQETS